MPEGKLFPKEFVALDLETSGIDPRHSEIIEVGAVRFGADGTVLEELDMLVRPEGFVPEAIFRLTGISPSELEKAATWEEVKPKVQAFIAGAPLVGQSINFDMDFLRAGGVKLSGEWYDTWHLSTALFPGLDAYSLEALSEEFGIELEDAHRAVSDCHACRELFLYDCWQLNRLDDSLKDELKRLSKQSKYPIGSLLDDLPPGNEPPKLSERTYSPRGAAVDLGSALAFPAGAKRLLNVSPGVDLTESLAKSLGAESPRAVIAVSSKPDQDYLLETLNQKKVSAAVLLDQPSVVSRKRLDLFLDQDKFSLTEAIFASKLIIWQYTTETGARSEVSFAGEEYNLWRQLSCDGLGEEELAAEPFWQRHLEEIKDAHQLLTTFRGLSEQHLPDELPLLISDFQLFDELMTSHLGAHVFSDSRAGEEEGSQASLDIVWGLLGMIVRNLAQEGSNGLRVTERVRASEEWKKLREALENTRERAKGDSRNDFIAAQIAELLDSGPDWVVWIDSDGERVSVHRAPLELDSLISRLAAARACLLLNSGIASLPEGFETVTADLQDAPQQKVLLLSDAPTPNNPNSVEYLRRLVLKTVETDPKRRIYVAFSSKAAAAEFSQVCGDAISGRALIGDGVTGNLNRVRLLFRRDTDQIVLGSMRSNRQGFLGSSFDTVIVPKLSFDPPGIPLHEARGGIRGAFGGYTVPRVAAKVLQLVSKLDPKGQSELILADGRLYSAKYGKDILEQLQLPVTAVTLDELFTAEE